MHEFAQEAAGLVLGGGRAASSSDTKAKVSVMRWVRWEGGLSWGLPCPP